MKLFDLESPLMQVLNKVADLMWLNVLTLICCIPIVTAGASHDGNALCGPEDGKE